MRTEISNLGEFGLIRHLTEGIELKNESSRYGVGDDAAVLSYPTEKQVLITTDLLMEGVHFDLIYVPLKHLGYKAAVVNFSDIYAMNGTPKQITVSLALSKRFSVEDMEELYRKKNYIAEEKRQIQVYDVKSLKAEEFISDEEIRETLTYADANKDNVQIVDEILAKARLKKGLTHREASVLLACEMPDKIWEMYDLAREIKEDYYGNRIVLFAPLYLSNYCVNGCVYCPYHSKNKHIARKKLTQEDIVREVTALQDMGHKRLAIEAGEDPVNNPIEYILECINTIYSIKHKNGAIRRVNVNIAATTVENYTKLKDAGIGTYILFQETYHKESYLKLHPTGPKHDYDYHTEAMDRAMEGGIDDVGLGVLFGLEMYRYEFAGLLMHAEHLEAVHGVGPHTISVPRIKRADDIDPDVFDNGISDDTFAKICALIRIAVPYTGMIISTRESQAVREKVLPLGVSQISGGSRTSVGGYDIPETSEDITSAQFDVSDTRTLICETPSGNTFSRTA